MPGSLSVSIGYDPGPAPVADPIADAASGKVAPIYLIASDHPILIERALHAVRDATVPAAMRAWNYDVVEGKATATRIVNACQTLPMMGAKRMIYVRDLAMMSADELTGLLPYFEAPSPSTVLFAVTSKLDKRLIGIVSLADLASIGQTARAGEALGGIVRPGGEHSQSIH